MKTKDFEPDHFRAIVHAYAPFLRNPAQREVITARFGPPPRTLESVATERGVSRERVRLIETAAIRNIIAMWERDDAKR